MHVKKVHGRKLGRPLNSARKQALEKLYPRYEIEKPCDTISTETLFENDNPTYLEIGFGNGEFLHNNCTKHPDKNFIGAEPFINGMSAFLLGISENPPQNVRLYMDDAIDIAAHLEDGALSGIYVLNPDPWPKKRHYKRRMITQENLNHFARILKSGAFLMMTSDVDDLSEWMCLQTLRHPSFEWTAKSRDDWRKKPEDWYTTRYEAKGKRAGRTQSYLHFIKK